MTPIEITTTVLLSIGGAGAVVVSLGSWLGRVWADRIERSEKARFDRVERSEKARFDREIEILKSSLGLQQERFNLLHAKRAEILSELYQHLVNAYSHTSAMAGKAERKLSVAKKSADAALDSVRAALNLLETRKIWLSKELAQRVSSLVYGLQKPILVYHYYVKDHYSDQDVLDAVTEWNARDAEVKQLLLDLEDEFRAILSSADRS